MGKKIVDFLKIEFDFGYFEVWGYVFFKKIKFFQNFDYLSGKFGVIHEMILKN